MTTPGPEQRRSVAAAMFKRTYGRFPEKMEIATALAGTAGTETLPCLEAHIEAALVPPAPTEPQRQPSAAESSPPPKPIHAAPAPRSSALFRITAPLRALIRPIPGETAMRWRIRARNLIFPPSPQPPPSPRPSAPTLPPASTAARDNAARWCTTTDPVVSIILLKRGTALATAHFIQHVRAHTTGTAYEILLADSTSRPEDLTLLQGFDVGVQLIETGPGRHFGETCNIAVEAAGAPFVCLLSDQAFVRNGWLTALLTPMQNDTGISATGPKLLRPDGRLHEAGRRIDAEGFVTPVGRLADPTDPKFNQPQDVDCLSTDCLLIRRADFMAARGFDLAYEPAGYEDADLCFKLRETGSTIRYCPTAGAVYFEAAPTIDSAEAARRTSLSDLNRAKFAARWTTRLTDPAPKPAPSREAAAMPGAPQLRKAHLPRAAIFTPFLLTPGGGERVILTLASVLSATHRVTIVTYHPYSRIRLLTLGPEFALDLTGCALMTGAQFRQAPPPDLFVLLGNHLFPSEPPHGVRNWYLCQFPFPMDAAAAASLRTNLPGYEIVLAYSPYAHAHILRAFTAERISAPRCEILFPPVTAQPGNATAKQRMVLSVGRFMSGGHTKRHDVLIDAFRVLHARCGDIELHLAGSSFPIPEDMDYLAGLMAASADLPVKFHVNATPETLRDLYRNAMFYWHATGYGLKPEEAPEQAEHFGITIVEAMSAGCVPLTFAAGGPCDIIAEGRTGYLFRSLDELVDRTSALLEPGSQALRQALGQAAADAAMEYSIDRFSSRVDQLLQAPCQGVADVQAAQAS